MCTPGSFIVPVIGFTLSKAACVPCMALLSVHVWIDSVSGGCDGSCTCLGTAGSTSVR